MDYSPQQALAWIVAGLGVVVGFYFVIPLLIYATQRMNGDPKIVIFDGELHRPPQRVADYLDETGEALMGLGFEPYPCVALPDPMPNVRAICQVWIHPARRDAALVSAIFGMSKETSGAIQTYYAEILSRFADDDVSLIQTNNASAVSAFPEAPGERTFRFPQVSSVGKLDRLHCRLVERYGPSRRKVVTLLDQFGGDLERYVRWALVDSYRKQERTGYLTFSEEGGCWRPTVKGAYLMTWSQLWPMSAILKHRIRREAQRLLRELGRVDDA